MEMEAGKFLPGTYFARVCEIAKGYSVLFNVIWLIYFTLLSLKNLSIQMFLQ